MGAPTRFPRTRPLLALAALAAGALLVAAPPAAAQTPAGQVTMAWHVTIAPSWFDPSTAPPQITPFGMLYALHDALVRPYPGHKMGPSLAESWKESADGNDVRVQAPSGAQVPQRRPADHRGREVQLRPLQGRRGANLHARVREVEIVDPQIVRFHLKEAWPDFMTFYGTTASAAGLVVPKKYIGQVGDAGFAKHPIGAGPYKFVSHKPGIEVVLEANTGYWRRVPIVKTWVMKSVPDASTRAVLLKSGEADIGVALDGPEAESIRADRRMQVVPSKHASIFWIEFAEQWDPKSPWADRRMRLAVNHALHRQEDQRGGVPGLLPARGRDRAPGHGLRAPGRGDAVRPAEGQAAPLRGGLSERPRRRRVHADPGFPTVAEATLNYLNAVGIRMRMRPMERAPFYASWREKKLRGVFMTAVGNSGNAASRVESFIQSKGDYAYGGYPDIDDLFQQQARERDVKKREALLFKIQQLTVDRVMFAPIMDLRALMGIGPRIAKHTITDVWMSPFPSFEDVTLKDQ